jgi:ATP-dependent exoDNAse (exonuclease V) alpha subunit
MAIYHYSVKAINRSTGRSSVAAAAYRSGEKLLDERTGEIFDYARRDGVVHSEVFLPDGETMPREALWNLAEASEKRKDAKVAREIVVALPHELSSLDHLTLVREYAKGLSRRTGWAVDVAVHAPGSDGDQRNAHAHLLCTTRVVERDAEGQVRLGAKTREWDVVSTGKELVLFERQEWERQVNKMLEIAHSKERVDSRSFEAQGKGELMPQVHLGVSASQMERKGIETERGNRNREAVEHNQNVVDLKQKRYLREIKQQVAQTLEDKRRWEGMSVQELEKERRSLDVGSERQFAYRDADVQEALTPLCSYPDYRDKQVCGLRGRKVWMVERRPSV